MGTIVSNSLAGISMILGAAATANSASTDFSSHDFEDCRRSSESELNDMRGGFEVNAGGMQLLLSLGIERVTYVNGILVAMNSLNLLSNLNIPQLGQVLNSQISNGGTQQPPATSSAPALASALPTGISVPVTASTTPTSLAVQSPPPATTPAVSSIPAATSTLPISNITAAAPVSTIPVSTLPQSSAPTTPVVSSIPAATSASPVSNIAAAAPASAIPVSTPPQSSAPITPATTTSAVAPSTPVAASPVSISLPNASIPSSFQPVQLAQVGQSNTFVPPNVTGLTSGIMTVVQNRLDNQVIQNMTIINATLANQDLIRSMAINAALNRISNALSR